MKKIILADNGQTTQNEMVEIDIVSKSYLYQMTDCSIMNLLVKIHDFQFNRKSLIKKRFSYFMDCVQ